MADFVQIEPLMAVAFFRAFVREVVTDHGRSLAWTPVTVLIWQCCVSLAPPRGLPDGRRSPAREGRGGAKTGSAPVGRTGGIPRVPHDR
jgi:hypothetical protein